MDKQQKNAIKKSTLEAWAKILLNEGLIDVDKYNKMIKNIHSIK